MTRGHFITARKKILILGNHDEKGAYTNYFDEIYTGPLFIAEKILLSHEPVYDIPIQKALPLDLKGNAFCLAIPPQQEELMGKGRFYVVLVLGMQ